MNEPLLEKLLEYIDSRIAEKSEAARDSSDGGLCESIRSTALKKEMRELVSAAQEAPLPPASRARNDLLDALCQYAELTDPLAGATPKLWAKCAAALKTIRGATPEVSPAEIQRRVGNYRSHFRDATISATALAAHWGRCAHPHRTHRGDGQAVLDPQFDTF